MVALFALVWTGGVTPTFMCAIMAFSEVGDSLVNLSRSGDPELRLIAIDDLVRSG